MRRTYCRKKETLKPVDAFIIDLVKEQEACFISMILGVGYGGENTTLAEREKLQKK